ncbi:hypothetical protein [Fusobacterium ulcerans]|uniref:hypothetical protein n=1 Tax=Fusobacterium ulcerans TaxID=861 RepID=UPI002E799C40|nr:hypothetical protein [Fusobacterium ulcerans]MEE0139407.1 hypothetical protein [Fusobacterium ulcerans]
MKSKIIIRTENPDKSDHILLSSKEIIDININIFSYDLLNKEPIIELFNEYYNEKKENKFKYESEPEVIITGKILNFYSKNIQLDPEEEFLDKKTKEYVENKFGKKLDLKRKEDLLNNDFLKLNKENVFEISSWQYTQEYINEKDYRDIIIEILPLEDNPIIIFLENMYIYEYKEEIDIKRGNGIYKLTLRKNPIIKENIEYL